jgi:hypothetical protein
MDALRRELSAAGEDDNILPQHKIFLCIALDKQRRAETVSEVSLATCFLAACFLAFFGGACAFASSMSIVGGSLFLFGLPISDCCTGGKSKAEPEESETPSNNKYFPLHHSLLVVGQKEQVQHV